MLFTLGSALCALATSIGMLVAFRVIQGLGGGLLMPIGMMMLTATSPEHVGSVMAVLGIPMLLGPIEPILGGVLIENLSWHWMLLINVPVGVVAFVYAAIVLRDDAKPALAGVDRLDRPAAAVPGSRAVPVRHLHQRRAPHLHGEGRADPRDHRPAADHAGFVAHALRAKKPLLDLRLFKNKTLSIAVTTMVLFMVAFFGAALLFPQYFIGVRGESTLTAGLLLAPQGLGAMLTMPIAGRLTDEDRARASSCWAASC